MRRAGWAAILAIGLALAACGRQESVPSADAGAQILAAGFPDLDGHRQAFSQWRGRVVVLNFWAPWCPPCRAEIPDFVAVHKQYRDKGVVFVGLALDRKDAVQAFVDEAGIDYPVLVGESEAAELAKAAGDSLGGLPYTVILDKNGTVAFSAAGQVAREELEKVLTRLM